MAKTELNDAIKKLMADKELQKKFMNDPKGILSGLGVDTTDMRFNAPKEAVMASSLCHDICVEVGFPIVGCTSVGSWVGIG